MRSVARTADVDAALVSYYFTNKAGLLDAALMTPPEFGDRIARAAAAPISRRGRALVQAMIDAWEDPTESVFLRSIILTAAHEPIAMDRLRDTFALVILDAVSAELPPEERGVRAALIASQVVGVVMTRYVWQIGPMAEMGAEDVVTLVAPTVQRYLTRPLPAGSTDKEP